MKTWNRFSGAVVVAWFMLLCQPLMAARRALIFAIGNYPEKTNGWMAIGSERDATLLKKTLEKQHFDDITIVKDKEATVAGISAEFEQLINDVKPGDVVVIHFSCHGRQLATTSGKVGGLDQCIVSYNAINEKQVKTELPYEKLQEGYFRGQLLGGYMKRLRSKLGKDGDLVLFLDYCHSGASTRGVARVRGGMPPLVPPGYKESAGTTGTDAYRDGTVKNRGDEDLASFEVFSACRPEESDQECFDDAGNDIGSLTYAVCKSFENLDSGATYRAFFAQVEQTMNIKASGQHPLLEGNGTERGFLGGRFFSQKSYVTVDAMPDSRHLVLDCGLFGGLDAGAGVVVAPAGTRDPNGIRPLANGTVTQSEDFKSTLELDTDVVLATPSAAWVFVTRPVFKVEPIGIRVSGFAKADSEKIVQGLQHFDLVSFQGVPEMRMVNGKQADSLLNAENGYCFDTISNAADPITALMGRLKRYAQYKYLAQINLTEPGVNFDVRLFPVLHGIADTSAEKTDAHTGDTLALWVKNTGDKPAYINILDIQPDGQINRLLPNRNYNIYPYNLKYAPGEAHNYYQADRYLVTVGPPYGREMLKIFASTREINMEDIATTRGVVTRGNLSALESLFSESYHLTRGFEGHTMGGDCTTGAVFFTISR